MADGGDLSGLRDRLTKLEFEATQRPTREYVQAEDEKVLRKAAENDRERNEVLLRLIDERLGAHRSAILSEMAKDHQQFRADVRTMLAEAIRDQVPNAVADEVDKIESRKKAEADKKAKEEERLRDLRDKKVQRWRNRFAMAGSFFVLLASIVTFYFAFGGDANTAQERSLGKLSDAITGFD